MEFLSVVTRTFSRNWARSKKSFRNNSRSTLRTQRFLDLARLCISPHAVQLARKFHGFNVVVKKNWFEHLDHACTLVLERFDLQIRVIDAVLLQRSMKVAGQSTMCE